MDVMQIEVKELKETQKEIERKLRELTGGPMIQAFRMSTLALQRDAKIFAPVDTGRLRASITPSVSATEEAVTGVVGSNVAYAPYQETGWWPLKGKQGPRYLQRSYEKNIDRIMTWIERAVKKITES